MKTTTTMITLALVCAGLATLMPAVGAVDIGCQRADASGAATVVGTPAGPFTNWTPTCVIIPNGGTVTWRTADFFPHGAADVTTGCFLFDPLTAGESQSATLAFADGQIVSDRLTQDGEASSTECGSELEVAGNGTLTVAYECVIHGAIMSAQIIIEGL